MEIIAGLLMIASGIAIAIFVTAAIAIARGEKKREEFRAGALQRDQIAASILYQVLVAGGCSADDALRRLRRDAGLAAQVTPGVDIANWGEAFARDAPAQRMWLLESAVQLVRTSRVVVPLRQYTALLDLSFALGFQTDALARLREKYPFEYIDHAKDARPREADRAGGATPLFVREEVDPRELLGVLEIEGSPSRQQIISAYRRLAARHHPDKHYEQTQPEQDAAAQRFIEITRAYEKLLAIYRD